jgi:hypothetical protein
VSGKGKKKSAPKGFVQWCSSLKEQQCNLIRKNDDFVTLVRGDATAIVLATAVSGFPMILKKTVTASMFMSGG